MGSDSSRWDKVRNWSALIVSIVAVALSLFSVYLSYRQGWMSQRLQLLQFLDDARDSLSGTEDASLYGSLTRDPRKLENARRSLDRARVVAPDNPSVLLYDGMYYEALGNWERATRLCDGAKKLSNERGRTKAVVCLGNILIDQGRLSEAEALLQSATLHGRKSAVIEANLCLVLSKEGRLPEAKRACGRAVEINPRSLPAQNNLGTLLLQEGDLRGAIDRFNKALAEKREQPEILANLGFALYLAGRDDPAIDTLEEALTVDAKNSFVREKLAELYRKKGDEIRAEVLEAGSPRQIEIH